MSSAGEHHNRKSEPSFAYLSLCREAILSGTLLKVFAVMSSQHPQYGRVPCPPAHSKASRAGLPVHSVHGELPKHVAKLPCVCALGCVRMCVLERN